MSTKRDYRVVEMSFDNKDFEQNVKTSLSTIQKLNNALKLDGATQGLLAVEKAIAQVTMDPILAGLDQVNDKFSALGVIGKRVLENLADSAVNAGKKIWNNTLGQIQSGGSARALNIANAKFKLEGLGVAWEKAEKDISQAVDGTAYGFDAAANTASQLATAGIELGDAYGGMAHSLRAVSGIAAMTNSSYEEIGYIFSQIASAGKLMGQDAMQISTRGINVTATLAKQLGKTTEEISEMQRKGEISFAMFAEAMNDAFGDQATKANETFQGAMSNVKAALSRIGEVFYGPYYKNMITPLNKIREAINRIKKMMDDGDDSTRDFKDRLTELLETLSKIVTYFTQNVDLRLFKNIINTSNNVLDKLNNVAHGWEKILGIFGKDVKASESVDKLTESLENLKEKEIEAARAIWIEGKYGNGEERISALKQAGFDEDEINRVQFALNKLVESGKTWDEFQKDLKTDVAETNEEVEETSKLTNNLVSSKIARTLERAGKIFTYIRMTAENLGTAIINVGKTVAESFLTVFPFDKIAKDAQNLMYKIWNLSTSLINLTANNTTIKRIADEIFTDAYNIYRTVKALARIAVTAAKSLWNVLSKNVKGLDTSWITLTNITDAIAMFTEDLADSADTAKFFTDIFQKLVDGVKKGIDYIKNIPNYVSSTIDKIGNFITELADKIEKLTGIDIMPFLNNIKTFFESFASVLTNPFKSKEGGGNETKPGIVVAAENVRDKVIDIFSKPEELAKGISDWFNNSLQIAKDNIKNVNLSNTISAFKRFKESFKEMMDTMTINIDGGKILKNARYAGAIGASVMSIVTAFNINKLVEILKKPSIQLKNIVQTVVGVFNNIAYTFKRLGANIDKIGSAVAWNIRSDIVMKIALSIAVMSGSLVAVALLPIDRMLQGVMAITTLSVSMTAMLLAVSRMPVVQDKSKANTTIIQATALMATMAMSMRMLAKMDYEDITKAVLALGAMEVLTTAMIAAVNASTQLAKDKNTKVVAKESKSLTGTILAITALMGSITLSLGAMMTLQKFMGKDSGKYLAGSVMSLLGMMTGILGVIVGFTGVTKWLKISDIETTTRVLGGTMVLMNALIPVVTAFTLLSYYTRPIDDEGNRSGSGTVWKAITTLASSLITIAAVLATLARTTNASDLAETAGSLGVMMLSLNALIPIVTALSIITYKYGWKSTATAGAVIVGILGVCSLILGILAQFTVSTDVLITSAALAAVFASFALIVPSILALSAVPSEKLKKVVESLSTLSVIVGAIFLVLGAVDTALGHGISITIAAISATILSVAALLWTIFIGLAKVVTAIGKSLKEFREFFDYFSGIDTSSITKFSKNLENSINEFCRVVRDVLPSVGETLVTFSAFLAEALKEITPYLSQIQNQLTVLVVTFASNIALTALRAIETFAEALLQVDDASGETFIYSVVSKVVRVITEILRAIFDGIFKETKDEKKVMGPMQPGQEQEGTSFWSRLANWIIDGFVQTCKIIASRADEINDAIVLTLARILGGLGDAINNRQPEIWAAITKMGSALWTSFVNYNAIVLDWVGEALGSLVKDTLVFKVFYKIYSYLYEFGEKIYEWKESVYNWGRSLISSFGKGIESLFGPIVEDVTAFFKDILDIIEKVTTGITNAMELCGASGITAFAKEFTPNSEAGKKSLTGVTGFAGLLTRKFVKATGTGSYNPKTGYAGEWMAKSVPMGMDKVKTWVTSQLESQGEDTANTFVGSIINALTGNGKSGKKSLTERLHSWFESKLNLKEAMGLDEDTFDWDAWADSLNVDTDDFSITPVIDMSEIDSGLEDIYDKFDSTDYDLGLSTSSDLASSIGSYDDTVFTGSSSSTDISALTAEVQKISDKINRLEVRIDSGTLVGAIVDKMNSSLGERQILAGRGVLT